MNLKSQSQKVKDRLSKKSVSDFEIYVESKEGLSLEVRNGKRDVCEIKSGLAFGIRILKDHKMVFAYGSDFSDSSIDFVIDQCLHAAKYQAADPHFKFPNVTEWPDSPMVLDPKFHNITYQEKLDFIIEMEQVALKAGKPVSEVKHASLDDELESILLENSNGLFLEQSRTAFCTSLGVQAELNGLSEISYEMDMQVCFEDLKGEVMAKRASSHAIQLLGGSTLPSYKGPIVIYRDVVAEIMDLWVSGFMGDNIYKNNSPLGGKLEEQVYHKSIQLYDDGLLEGSANSGAFDGEGVPCQKTVLVEDGVVKNFLYDTYWANRCGKKTTGNGLREDVTCEPGLSYHNLCLAKGDHDFESLLSKMGDGLLVLDVIGMHNADEVSGDFSVGLQGLCVKNGKLEQAFRSMVLTDNIHDIFKRVEAVGSDFLLCGGLGAVSLLVDEAHVSGSND